MNCHTNYRGVNNGFRRSRTKSSERIAHGLGLPAEAGSHKDLLVASAFRRKARRRRGGLGFAGQRASGVVDEELTDFGWRESSRGKRRNELREQRIERPELASAGLADVEPARRRATPGRVRGVPATSCWLTSSTWRATARVGDAVEFHPRAAPGRAHMKRPVALVVRVDPDEPRRRHAGRVDQIDLRHRGGAGRRMRRDRRGRSPATQSRRREPASRRPPRAATRRRQSS